MSVHRRTIYSYGITRRRIDIEIASENFGSVKLVYSLDHHAAEFLKKRIMPTTCELASRYVSYLAALAPSLTRLFDVTGTSVLITRFPAQFGLSCIPCAIPPPYNDTGTVIVCSRNQNAQYAGSRYDSPRIRFLHMYCAFSKAFRRQIDT